MQARRSFLTYSLRSRPAHMYSARSGGSSRDVTRAWLVLYALLGAPVLAAQGVDSSGSASDTTSAARPVPPARTATDLLVARFPGVVVYPSSGLTGSGSRVRTRG